MVSNGYGKYWQNNSLIEWYKKISNDRNESHLEILNFINSKKDINSIIEIGGGTCVYFKEKLDKYKYTNIDISKPAIEYCKQHNTLDHHQFILADFIKIDNQGQNLFADLVFSTAVLDHVYDINKGLQKLLDFSEKYIYIVLYYGYHDKLEHHESVYSEDQACFYNKCSLQEIEKILNFNKLNYKIKKFKVIRSKEWHQTWGKNYPFLKYETHIICEK